jgi:WD40 repeat protein
MSFFEKIKEKVKSMIETKLKSMVPESVLEEHANNQAEEYPNDYTDDGEEYHVIPEAYDFTYSSYTGDFRLHRLNNGFCASWKTFIVARDWDGNEMYRINGYGRSVILSPDKTKLAASSKNKSIAIFDAATGEMIGEPVYGEAYLSDLLWTKNGHIIANNSDKIFVMDELGVLQYSFGKPEGGDFDFISGLCLFRYDNDQIIIAEGNSKRLTKVNFKTKEIIHEVEHRFQMSEVFSNHKNNEFWIVKDTNGVIKIQLFDAELEHQTTIEHKGKRGVRFVGQTEHSCTAWASLPALSPDETKFLMNDQSGLLYLISAGRDNACYRIFNRDLVDYAYAMIWEDDNNFVVILDNYKVIKVNTRGMEPIFTQSDQ